MQGLFPLLLLMKPDENVWANMKIYREIKFRHFMSFCLLRSLGKAMSSVVSMKEISRKKKTHL